MKPTLKLELSIDGSRETHTFDTFPVRIGRDEDCELQLPYAFVSREHARIEHGLQDGFFLVDEGGRNGISIRGVRVASGEWIALVDGSEFSIETLVIKVRFVPASETTTAVYAETETLLFTERSAFPELLARVGAAMDDYRTARAAALATIASSMSAIPEAQRATVLRQIVTLHGELATDPVFRAVTMADEAAPTDNETEALAGLQQLARAYVPDATPPSDVRSVRAFLGALDRALRTFLLAKPHLDPILAQGDAGRNGDPHLERAHLLARELLDWRVDTTAAATRTSRELEAIALHHSTLIAEVCTGVSGILDELSPAAIQIATGTFWSRTLWRELMRRHAAITSTLHERLGPRFHFASAHTRDPTGSAGANEAIAADSICPDARGVDHALV